MIERLISRAEIRAEGRRLTGVVMPYDTVSPSHSERFAPGSIRLGEVVHLDIGHDPLKTAAWHPGGGLELRNDRAALTMTADIPPIPAGDAALEMVRAGRATGLSVEFHALKENEQNGIRIIEQALLSGIGIVDSPSYDGARVEARRRSGQTLRAEIPVGSDVDCECVGAGCTRARLLEDAFSKMWDSAFEETTRRVTAAYLNSYAQPLASTARGTLRGSVRGTGFQGRQPTVDIDLPDSEAGRALLSAWEDSGIVVRPFIAEAEGLVVDGVKHIESGRLRAFVVSATDARQGWPAPEILATPDELVTREAMRTRRRLLA